MIRARFFIFREDDLLTPSRNKQPEHEKLIAIVIVIYQHIDILIVKLIEIITQLLDDSGSLRCSYRLLVNSNDDACLVLDTMKTLLVFLGPQDAIGCRQENEPSAAQSDAITLEVRHIRVILRHCHDFGARQVKVGRLGPQRSVRSDNGGGFDASGSDQLVVNVILPRHFTDFISVFVR